MLFELACVKLVNRRAKACGCLELTMMEIENQLKLRPCSFVLGHVKWLDLTMVQEYPPSKYFPFRTFLFGSFWN